MRRIDSHLSFLSFPKPSLNSMKYRYLLLGLAFLLIVGTLMIYLVLTGERNSPRQSQFARSLDITRLDPAENMKMGWNPKGLDAVFEYVATLSTDSMMIVTDGQIVGAFGNLSKPYNVHSIRKVFLSALVGQHVGADADNVPLNATLQSLGIDDAPMPLSDVQKSVTVTHLLKSTSGINHPAAAEGGLNADKNRRLGNGENQPGTIWAYNNWDYNALTTIFEERTGLGIPEAFLNGIAEPAGMKDFKIGDVSYISDFRRSKHRAAMFQMSARDLATFGQIYLNKGRLDDKQILPSSWIERIVNGYTETGRDDLRWGHSDLWWIPNPKGGFPEGSYWGWGLGNQALFVIPEWNTVIVLQSDTTEFLKRRTPLINNGEKDAESILEELILFCFNRSNRQSEYCIEHRFTTSREMEKFILLIGEARI